MGENAQQRVKWFQPSGTFSIERQTHTRSENNEKIPETMCNIQYRVLITDESQGQTCGLNVGRGLGGDRGGKGASKTQ